MPDGYIHRPVEAGPFVLFYVPGRLFVRGNAAATANNKVRSSHRFRSHPNSIRQIWHRPTDHFVNRIDPFRLQTRSVGPPMPSVPWT